MYDVYAALVNLGVQVTMARSKANASAMFKLGRRSAGALASSTLRCDSRF